MKQIRIWRKFLLTLGALGLAGCSAESLTAPKYTADASAGLVGDLVSGLIKKDVLKRTKPLPRDIRVAATIGKNGGTLSIPEAGLHLTIPAGAVNANTRFTVTALKGSLVAYEFGPHGIEFNNSLTLRQDLSATEWTLLNLRPLIGGYFAETKHLNETNGTALLSELLQGVVVPIAKQFSFRIDHFSGYVVAW